VSESSAFSRQPSVEALLFECHSEPRFIGERNLLFLRGASAAGEKQVPRT